MNPRKREREKERETIIIRSISEENDFKKLRKKKIEK